MSLNALAGDAVQHVDQLFSRQINLTQRVGDLEGVGFYEVTIYGSAYSISFILQVERFPGDPFFRPLIAVNSSVVTLTRNDGFNQLSLTLPSGESVTFDVHNHLGWFLMGSFTGFSNIRMIFNKF